METVKAGSLARRAIMHVSYNNQNISESISKLLTSFSFSDTIGGTGDSFSFSVADRDKKWMNKWKPETGASLHAAATFIGWDDTQKERKRQFGDFDISGIDLKGPPNSVTILASSIPKNKDVKTKRTKSYENTTFKKVAQIVADRIGVKLLFHCNDNPAYDRLEQSRENDLVFINRVASEASCCIKISTKYLAILDEATLEKKESITTLKATDRSLKDYSFKETLTGIYKQCTVSYTSEKTKKTTKVTFTPKNAKSGDTLFVSEEFKTTAAGMRIAKSNLREKNKEAITSSLKYAGFLNLYAGDTVDVYGYGAFDGKYIIMTINGGIGSGTETTLDLRKCLKGY